MTETTPSRRPRKTAAVRGGNVSSARPATDLAPPPAGPAERRRPEPDLPDPGRPADGPPPRPVEESLSTPLSDARERLAAEAAGPKRFVIVAGILPRDEGTQRQLSVEVDQWWATLPLGHRLGIHAALAGETL